MMRWWWCVPLGITAVLTGTGCGDDRVAELEERVARLTEERDALRDGATVRSFHADGTRKSEFSVRRSTSVGFLLHGAAREWHSGGQLAHTARYEDGKLIDQELEHRAADGTVTAHGRVRRGEREGRWTLADLDGSTWTGRYAAGVPQGSWVRTPPDGAASTVVFDRGRPSSTRHDDPSGFDSRHTAHQQPEQPSPGSPRDTAAGELPRAETPVAADAQTKPPPAATPDPPVPAPPAPAPPAPAGVNPPPPAASEPSVFGVGAGVIFRSTGLTYHVEWSRWSDRLVGGAYGKDGVGPDAHFLCVRVRVSNQGKEPQTIPSFRLVDHEGRGHDSTGKAWAVEGVFSSLDSLNPGVSRSGLVIFDVLKFREGDTTRWYRLEVSSEAGWLSTTALMALKPERRKK